MKVRVTEGSHLVHNGEEYRAGDTFELEGKPLEVQLNAGTVVKAEKVKKSKKEQ